MRNTKVTLRLACVSRGQPCTAQISKIDVHSNNNNTTDLESFNNASATTKIKYAYTSNCILHTKGLAKSLRHMTYLIPLPRPNHKNFYKERIKQHKRKTIKTAFANPSGQPVPTKMHVQK